MDNLHTPQSPETKKYLEEECGLRPWTPTREPNYANPDKMECKYDNRCLLGHSLTYFVVSLP